MVDREPSRRTVMRLKSSAGVLTRRELLASGAAAAGVFGFGLGLGGVERITAARAAAKADLYGPFKMGLQSYSLRGYKINGQADRAKALELTRKLGLHYWEAYPNHIPYTLSAAELNKVQGQLKEAGVRVAGYGVIPFTKDAAAARKYFEFARTMGIDYLSADPALDSFDVLDKLVEEYGVGVGIHNHGPGHHYAEIDVIAATIKDHHPKIGCCIDTGHFLRSREDPVRAAEVFKGRIYGVHLKDVKDAVHFSILGQGDLRTRDLLKALAAQNYKQIVALEYEEKPEDPVADVETCLKYVQKIIAEGL